MVSQRMMSWRRRAAAWEPNSVVSSSTERSLSAAQWWHGSRGASRGAHPQQRADPAGRRRHLPRVGGADSTCLWHVLRELGYDVAALHVDHGLRGAECEEDARLCREVFGAEIVKAAPASTEAALRELRYSYATDRLRATGHTARTRSRRFSTGSCPAAARGASSFAARTESCGHCSSCRMKKPRATAERSGSPTASIPRTPTRSAD